MSGSFKRYVFAALIVAGVVGCSEDSPQQRSRAKYATYPENIRKAIDNGDVLKGMTQEQVILAIGETQCVDSRTFGGVVFENWMYEANANTKKLSRPKRCGPGYQIMFEDGYVIDGQTQ